MGVCERARARWIWSCSSRKEENTNELRAVKKLHAGMGSEMDHKRELSILVSLKDHRDLFVQFRGWYMEKGCILLAMEYVEHGDLRGFLKRSGKQSEESAKEIAMQVLEGLVILHGRSICYRDLKPENILLSSLSPIHIKLADFGISKSTADTRLVTQIGTRNYLAPEVNRSLPLNLLKLNGEYESSFDLWSLGCLLHEVLRLKLPFTTVDSSRTYDSTISGVVPISSTEFEFDNKAFFDFCYGTNANLSTGTLRAFNISERGIEFIKSLLVPDPRSRPSAANAMKSEWLLELPQSSNGVIYDQQKTEPEILRSQMFACGMGVSLRTINTLINRGGGSSCKALLHKCFLKTEIADILQRALKEGYSLFVLILKQELDIDRSLFDEFFDTALVAGDLGTIKTLSRINYIKRNSYSRDILYTTVKGGHVEMAKLLLEGGADVNAVNHYGRTALQTAVLGGHIDMVALLQNQ
ncbi:kinase-like protein [Morchella conica CCBAS932]|uniref:Kinase-like protein n=1 Tax=Morchella conica CCBAS932 TaxID=1392247 RepID=A0A3N4KAP3_9PEZI|nr:kinase-like protein [Morchella conica CCBAS932]